MLLCACECKCLWRPELLGSLEPVIIVCEPFSMWGLRIELRSSAGALSTLNYWAIPSAPYLWFWKRNSCGKTHFTSLLAKTVQRGGWHCSLFSFFSFIQNQDKIFNPKLNQDKAFRFYKPMYFRSGFFFLFNLKFFDYLRFETWNFTFMFMCKSFYLF